MRARQASVSCVGVTVRARMRAEASASVRRERSSEVSAKAAIAPRTEREKPRRVRSCIGKGYCKSVTRWGRERCGLGLQLVDAAERWEEPRPQQKDSDGSESAEHDGRHSPEPLRSDAGLKLPKFV